MKMKVIKGISIFNQNKPFSGFNNKKKSMLNILGNIFFVGVYPKSILASCTQHGAE
jgi:hypothetical protein